MEEALGSHLIEVVTKLLEMVRRSEGEKAPADRMEKSEMHAGRKWKFIAV